MSEAAGATIHRKLSKSQLEKRERIVRAGVELAREHGYDDFSTRDVARQAGVALGTVYHNFTSKDHLLAEGLLAWLDEFDEQLERDRIRGRTITTRLVELYRRMALRASEEPRLYEALRRAMMSPDESVSLARRAHSDAAARWFEAAIGSGSAEDVSALIEVLEYIFVGAFLTTPVSEDSSGLVKRLERSVRFVTRNL